MSEDIVGKDNLDFSSRICLFLNRFFPKVERRGRADPMEYAEAQYQWAKTSLSYFKDQVELRDKVILDAGCSLGGKTLFYSEQGIKSIVGIDLDAIRIEFAKQYANKKNKEIEFKIASIADMPFDDDTFDIIFLNDVVEHLDRNILLNALKESKRVIKTEGKICLEFPPWQSHDASHLYDYIQIPWCHLIFSDETLIQVVQSMETVKVHGQLGSIEHFRELNRIKIPEFDELVKKTGLAVKYHKCRMIKRINNIKIIPFINKYLTTRAIYILTK